MHAQGAGNYPHFKECRAYETAFELKAEGKIRHVGISFHDRAEVLEQILTDYPEIEVVQIQFNYVDYDDPAVQSRKCYEVCRKFGKPIIVMEPVKGGNLVNLPEEAKTAAQVSEGAANGDELCFEALSEMFDFLGVFAGNLALTAGAFGGVYLAGGILPRPSVLKMFKESSFRKSFEGKGRFNAYLSNVPTYVMTAENPAFLGLAGLVRKKIA